MKKKVVLVSGSFDPLHIGHIAYLKAAKKLGDVLVVAIKGNDRLKAKKKRHFMNEDERKNILESLKYIDKVIVVDSPGYGMIAPLAIPVVRPDIYANGESNKNPELESICREYGVKIKYGVGGKRIRSSTELLKEYYQTPWEK
jgi:D-beta-D-heptose 7-phosphate kinase/D-beta-D-heptose 1-phosphate adenosyltransferase